MATALFKTRFAPTPSGFLHLGNLASMLLTSAMAKKMNAGILLRIDDLDRERVRDEYIQDIFETLHYFGLKWDEGPNDAAEFMETYSQLHRKKSYDAALQFLADQDAVYACNCSRTQLASNLHQCPCVEKRLPLNANGVAWRLRQRVDKSIVVLNYHHQQEIFSFPEQMQHLMVRKKDGNASYQLASVVDDIQFGVNMIVRGKDLLDSTIAQAHLSTLLPENSFHNALFLHHPLLLENDGNKMSKSNGAQSLHQLRKNKTADEILRLLAGKVGMSPLPMHPDELMQYLTDHWIADMASAKA
jgi:glutamyl-tRNA synthetase